MMTPPQALPAAMLILMTANVQAKPSAEPAAGTARCTDALSAPSQGDSGRPSGIMRTAMTARSGAAASSASVAPNSARQVTARPSTSARQFLVPYARPPARLPALQIATSTPTHATPPWAAANATKPRLSIPPAAP